MPISTLPRPVRDLGLAGLLPQAACLAIVFISPEDRFSALAAGTFYPALILSFLGGLWWMQALSAGDGRWEPYLLAVVPSLAAWGLMLPWCFGWTWPGPELKALAFLLALTPLVDLRLARRLPPPPGWMALRWRMAGGLAVLTFLLSLA